MTTWQKGILILGAILLAYVGFDETRDYGIFWQTVGMIVGGLSGAIIGFILLAHIFGSSSEED